MDLREVGYDDRDWINLTQDRDQWRAHVRAAMNLRVPEKPVTQGQVLNHKGILKSIQTFLPKNIVRASDEDLETAVQAVVNQWPIDVDASPEYFFNELRMWRRNFLDQKNLQLIPTVFISSLNRFNEIIFPCTRKALKLFCTLPATTATPERSFSTLRYLKTYLRSTMGADRLNGLALMYIHKM
ncbi:hypothetical protein ANN_25643 [Periplaneta americana]|uniref:HAT C-terminal dimerisation domain-containing protein n=1 Tax=Periplaneta americana TaxID=6978 RepID=A0ABQ8S421_PERAM|nr:hypothetical protein ANN_25643 [Periplaneta americana]